jgi:putative nucleotidyltransferase with HDIG domain
LNKRLKKMLEQSVHAISVIGELKDPYTAGHQRRVEKLACAMARRMGCAPQDVVNISFGALIHDIGKIYIPSDILNKSGKLSDLEYELLRTHVEQSYAVAQEIDFPSEVAEMIRQHHERLDGTGYPLGLSGDDIIFEARILAVADVVESMTSHRPYRAAVSLETALHEVQHYSGIKFDPIVVESCLDVFREEEFSWD